MKHIRKRVIELLEEHSGTYSTCSGCSICAEIELLKKLMVREPAEKFKHLLIKGQDMTKSDIELLLENDVPKKIIMNALDMYDAKFYELLSNYGFPIRKRQKKKVEDEMARETLNIDINEFIQLHHVEGKSFTEIENIKGLKTPAFANWRWRKKQEIKKAVGALQESSREKIKLVEGVSSRMGNESKLQALVDDLRRAVQKRDKRIEELEKGIDRWKKKYEHLNEACEDLEQEASQSVDINIDQLKKQIEYLQSELAPLRQLAYIKLKMDVEAK